MKKGLFLLAFISANILHSQMSASVTTAVSAVSNLVGPGVTVSSIQTFSSSANSLGLFTNGLSGNMGINSGVYLTTGDITLHGPLLGDPPSTFISNGNGTPGDADLDALSGVSTYDASILQFDFVPAGDTVKFQYVFSSEEYNDYTNSTVNDAFGFFVTGPNPGGGSYANTNVALIPGTSVPVSINTVNNGYSPGCASGPCEYCTYFIDNECILNNFCYDGYTVVLEVVFPVYACSTYTLKMAIADGGDGVFDSGVFLKAGSFTSNEATLSGSVNFGPNDSILVEDCNLGIITFTRTDTTGADTITFNVAGTAIEGVDFTNLPNDIIFPPGEDTVTLVVDPFQDFITEGMETIILTINTEVCGNPTAVFHYYIFDTDSLDAILPSDTSLCAGSPLLLNAIPSGGIGLYTISQWNDPSGGFIADSSIVNITQDGYYIYALHDFCIATTYFDSIRVQVFPVPNIPLPDQDICSTVGELIGPAGTLTGFNYQWSPAINLSLTNIANPAFVGTNPGPGNQTFTYTLTVDSGGISCYEDSLIITLHPTPIVDLGPDTTVCESGSLDLNAGNPGYSYLWSTAAVTQSITVTNPGTYAVLITSPVGCIDTDTINLVVDSLPHFKLDDVTVCEGDSAVLWVHSNEGDNFLWSTLETDTMIFTFTPGLYNIAISNHCGVTVDTAEVKFLPDLNTIVLPNILTPNGDGVNDIYDIPLLSQASSFRMDFFNRWGTLLFTTEDATNVWKGTSSDNTTAAPGTYFVILKFFDCQHNEITRQQFITLFQ
jgi:gliding motility-associated-like protein